MSKPIPSIYSVDLFIGKFFAMKASPNNQLNYQKCYDQLQWINPSLYSILDSFWKKWEEFDIYEYDQDQRVYKEFTDTLMYQLGEWTVRTIHTKHQDTPVRKELRNAV